MPTSSFSLLWLILAVLLEVFALPSLQSNKSLDARQFTNKPAKWATNAFKGIHWDDVPETCGEVRALLFSSCGYWLCHSLFHPTASVLTPW